MPNSPDREVSLKNLTNTRIWGLSLIVLGVFVIGAAALINYEALTEAFGAGPPYYSRTTNMDKWINPLPQLLLGDLVALVVGGLLIRTGIKNVKARVN